MTVTRSAVLLRALLGVTVIMVQTILKLAFLATTAIAAPAADAEADPFYGLAYAHPAPIVHALPICKAVPKTVVVGKRCHAEPECTTKSVVVGKALKGHEDPVCTEVEVPALGYGHIGKREAEAEPFYGLAYGAHLPVPVAHTVKTKSCVPGAPILEDISQDVTTCVPKQVCEDVSGTVLETVCGEEEAAAEE